MPRPTAVHRPSHGHQARAECLPLPIMVDHSML